MIRTHCTVEKVKGHDSLGTANVAANWARQLQRHKRHAEAGPSKGNLRIVYDV